MMTAVISGLDTKKLKKLYNCNSTYWNHKWFTYIQTCFFSHIHSSELSPESRTSHSKPDAILSMIANLITYINRYVENGEWILLGVRSQRNVMTYDCCEGKFPDVTYHLELRRRTLFYLMNFILPCVLIAVLTLLVFLLPPESGERMSFGVTVLLSFTILLLMLMVGVTNMSCKLVRQDPLGFDKGRLLTN